MSHLSVQGEQSTSSEIELLTALNNLGTSGALQAIQKTGAGTFANVDLSAAGDGTVTSVSVVTANGISGTVATATTTPAITLSLGAITPSSITISTFTAGSVLFAGTGGLVSQDNANFFWDDTNNRLGLRTITPLKSLDISDGAAGGAILIGADTNATTRTDATQKIARTAFSHYTNAQAAISLIGGLSNSTTNVVSVGGGSSSLNAATSIDFYTAATTTTLTGTVVMTLSQTTNTGILTVPSAALKGWVVKGAASQTANLAEFQNSSGTAYVTIGAPTLAGDSTTKNWLNVTGTMPTTMTAITYGVHMLITGAGSSSFINHAFRLDYLAGYTGSSVSTAASFINRQAGTNTTAITSTIFSGNIGVGTISLGTTTGHNYALWGEALNGIRNVGVLGLSVANKDAGTNIGVMGWGTNSGASSPIQIGGYFGLHGSTETPTFASAALIADNAAQASNIFVARDNGTAVVTVADFGNLTFAPRPSTSGSPTLLTFTAPAHTTLASGTEATDINFNLARTVQFATSTPATQRAFRIQNPTYSCDTSSQTITTASTLSITGAPVAGTNVTITNAYALMISAGAALFSGRVLESQGVDVAAANDLTLGEDGNTFEITGATQINAITTARWSLGSRITLIFASTPTVKHNTAGGAGTAVILLAGAADFSATAGDTLTLRYSEQGGTNAWREIGRAAI